MRICSNGIAHTERCEQNVPFSLHVRHSISEKPGEDSRNHKPHTLVSPSHPHLGTRLWDADDPPACPTPPPGLPLLLPSWSVCFLLFSVPFLPLPPSWLATPHPALFSSSCKQGGHTNARTNSRANLRSSSRRPSPRDVLLAVFIQGTRTNCRVYWVAVL